MIETKKYKLITLVGVVCFPQMPINCDIRRESSKGSVIEAFEKGEQVILVTQTKNVLSKTVLDSINPVGCLCDAPLSTKSVGVVLARRIKTLKRDTRT